MMVDTLVQIRATHKANRENGGRQERRKVLMELLRSHPVMTMDRDSHKLRSSKWFNHDEIRIVCSVVESGFIVERRNTMRNDSLNIFGIALWDQGYEKSKDPKHLKIYSLNDEIVYAFKLKEFWTIRTQIKISNSGDRLHPVNDEEAIRSQIKRAEKMKFERDEHFVCFCRYGKPKRFPDGWSLSNIIERFRAFSAKW